MTKTVELDVAQATLDELIRDLAPDDEVVIVQNSKPVARIVAASNARSSRTPGNCRGMLSMDIEDDEHLKDFEEYMQ